MALDPAIKPERSRRDCSTGYECLVGVHPSRILEAEPAEAVNESYEKRRLRRKGSRKRPHLNHAGDSRRLARMSNAHVNIIM